MKRATEEANVQAKLEDARMRRQFENLARMTHAWAENGPLPEQAPEWVALERAMRRRTRTVTQTRLLAGAALGVAAVAAVLFVRGAARPAQELSFVVSGAGVDSPVVNGQVRSGVAPVRVTFSDGSAVVLQPGARGRVLGTTAEGARVKLEAGRARFAITHRPKTEWSVAAGPFTVVVHGTVFEVGWSADTGALEVGLTSGSVSVRGPVAAGAIVMRPGQRLTAHAATRETRIDRLSDPVPASLEVAPPTPSESGSAGAELPLAAPAAVEVGAAPRPAAQRRSGGSRGAGRPHAASAIRDVSASWAARVASGAFTGVVEDADALGVERCLAQVSAPALAALADAARYGRRTELARRALLAERRRFAGTAAAHDAAFLLGRLADDTTGDAREALRWYERYLAESADGTYGAEALGRKMLALDRLGRAEDARAAAGAYRAAFPDGPHATRAARLLGRR